MGRSEPDQAFPQIGRRLATPRQHLPGSSTSPAKCGRSQPTVPLPIVPVGAAPACPRAVGSIPASIMP